MGFYSPSQLVQDARRHGVEVRPVDVLHSELDCTLEPPAADAPASKAPARFPDRLGDAPQPAVRLGLRRVASLSEAGAKRIVDVRAQASFSSTEDLALRAELDARDMGALAAADALASLSGHRRQQVWEATAQRRAPALLKGVPIHEQALALPAAPEGEEIVGDYASLGLTLRRHPLALLRPRLARMRLASAAQLHDLKSGQTVRACGIVMGRQRPQTANNTMFVTLEDETGNVNVVVWRALSERQKAELLGARLLAVHGVIERDGEVVHLVARRLLDFSVLLGPLTAPSRDFH
jgi:error-prone DNA polymerase